MPAGRNEETYCLTAIDVFSKYLFAIPIKGKSASVVAAAFLDQVIGQGRAVLAVHSDNGKEMKNKLFERMTRLLQIRHSYSMPYHPQGNAAIESSHNRIKMVLRASLDNSFQRCCTDTQFIGTPGDRINTELSVLRPGIRSPFG